MHLITFGLIFFEAKKYGIDNGSFDHLGSNIKWTFVEKANWIRVLTENKQSLVTKYALANKAIQQYWKKNLTENYYFENSS